MTRPITIFIADDNPADVQLFREAVKQSELPCDFLVAADGEIAAGMIASFGLDIPVPDLAIIDLVIPKGDGADLLRLLRTTVACARLPVLVATSSQLPRDLDQVLKYGAAYFSKPSDWLEFQKVAILIRDLTQAKSTESHPTHCNGLRATESNDKVQPEGDTTAGKS